jgi:hypothetical protein
MKYASVLESRRGIRERVANQEGEQEVIHRERAQRRDIKLKTGKAVNH